MNNPTPEQHETPIQQPQPTPGDWLSTIHLWGRMILRALQDASAPESQLVASSISYFTLLSLFPLALFVFALASKWLDPLLAEARIVAELEFVVPGFEALLGENLQNIASARGPVTGLAALMLLWSASNVFNVITRTMDRIWGADINHRRSVWRHRTLAILMVLIVTMLLLMASTVEGAILAVLDKFLPDVLSEFEPFTTRFWAILLNILLFTLLYYFIPHVKIGWRDVLPGAIMAGLLWQWAKILFLYFATAFLSRSNLVYGSFGTIIAFLTWAYFSSLILLFGAYLNRQVADRLTQP
ncbi:MAG: YihY/virulence factor BrkB family protein [Anaerolineae bacterium]|nr:YihY/virulence factor BrkB family protein [Anaerolineae bacterium]